jgi:hypothetical protein
MCSSILDRTTLLAAPEKLMRVKRFRILMNALSTGSSPYQLLAGSVMIMAV